MNYAITRDDIVSHLERELTAVPYIHALWLEGADANLMVDAYSDLDIWIDVDDEHLEESFSVVETALARLAPLDYHFAIEHEHPKIRQRFYHLAGSSPYLMIDFCWQLHSRDPIYYYQGSRIEAAAVLFDKSAVIRHQAFEPDEQLCRFRHLIDEACFRYDQLMRVEKYMQRGLWPEAKLHYDHYVIEPLVTLLRILYTPTHTDYGLVHISAHLPAGELDRLDPLLRVASFADMVTGIDKGQAYFRDLLSRARRQTERTL